MILLSFYQVIVIKSNVIFDLLNLFLNEYIQYLKSEVLINPKNTNEKENDLKLKMSNYAS